MRGASYGIGAPDYRETASDNLLIICQIESRRAVENIEAIAAVDGVDMLLIGPNDLAGTIGRLGELEHPEVMALVTRPSAQSRRPARSSAASRLPPQLPGHVRPGLPT
ncbi:MAG: aldolase/citrate lyase family protein [Pseudomonadota bacterium]